MFGCETILAGKRGVEDGRCPLRRLTLLTILIYDGRCWSQAGEGVCISNSRLFALDMEIVCVMKVRNVCFEMVDISTNEKF